VEKSSVHLKRGGLGGCTNKSDETGSQRDDWAWESRPHEELDSSPCMLRSPWRSHHNVLKFKCLKACSDLSNKAGKEAGRLIKRLCSGLPWGKLCSWITSPRYSECPLYGNRVTAYTVKFKWAHTGIKWACNPHNSCLYRVFVCFFFNFLFWWIWGLNSGPHVC
jgi:hypothetical protein